MGIDEANPVMSYFLEKSTIEFAVAKLGISFFSLGILNYFSGRFLSKVGVIIIGTIYLLVAIMHIIALFII